jgi:hypothetical protein
VYLEIKRYKNFDLIQEGNDTSTDLIRISTVYIRHIRSGFGGLVVSMLTYGTQVRGFKPA